MATIAAIEAIAGLVSLVLCIADVICMIATRGNFEKKMNLANEVFGFK